MVKMVNFIMCIYSNYRNFIMCILQKFYYVYFTAITEKMSPLHSCPTFPKTDLSLGSLWVLGTPSPSDSSSGGRRRGGAARLGQDRAQQHCPAVITNYSGHQAAHLSPASLSIMWFPLKGKKT